MMKMSKAGVILSMALLLVFGGGFYTLTAFADESPKPIVVPRIGQDKEVSEDSARALVGAFKNHVGFMERCINDAEAILAKGNAISAADVAEYQEVVSALQELESMTIASLSMTGDALYADLDKQILRKNIPRELADSFHETWDRFEKAESWMMHHGV